MTCADQVKLQPGDFTGLANNYSLYRPAYANSVLSATLALQEKSVSEIDFADVGAGTGIWTRMVESAGVHSTFAVEPNDDMRNFGEKDSANTSIRWLKGTGEQTGLADNSIDLLSMASSFHWVDFDSGVKEFHRVLRPGGAFLALWNPRYIEANPLLIEIENMLHEMVPTLNRVSSGRSGITATLTDKLLSCPLFSDVNYLEGYHTVQQSISEYLGVWWSVNDIRVQAGEAKFAEFMKRVEDKVSDLEYVETTYQTRAWMAKTAR